MKINNKTVWITGASSGIGEALATQLFSKGATVILSARNIDKLNKLKSNLDAIQPGRCHVIPCDVTSQVSVTNAAAQIMSVVERVDILINNAGVSQRSLALQTNISVDRALLEVNFFGSIMVTKSILPWMISMGGGHIVVMSSMAGKYGFRMRSSYAASKHALHGFYETLRAEVHDQNIKITLICPGRIKTDISVNSLTGDGSKYGIMDAGQSNGVPVERCARIVIKAIQRNRKEVFIGGLEFFLLMVKRICTPLYYWIVNRASPM